MRAIRLGDENEPDTNWDKFKDLLSRHPWRTVTGGVITFLIGSGSLWALVDDRPLIPVVAATAKSMFPSGAWSMRNVGVLAALVLMVVGLMLPFVVAFAAARYRREAQRLDGELRRITGERDRLRIESQNAEQLQKELNDYKEDVAHRTLHRHRGMMFNGVQPVVTIRFAAYGNDFELVQRIESIIGTWLGWQVTKDGSNAPALVQAAEFKVIFASGFTMSYDDLAHAFSEGNLLGVPVGKKMSEREDSHHLVIEVLPSA